MLYNENTTTTFNNFKDVPSLTYKIFTYLIMNETTECNNFWKVLNYPVSNPLSQSNLNINDRRLLIWEGDSLENGYKLFNKPLVSDSLIDANNMIQIRMYRYNLIPIDRLNATIMFEVDFYTNDKLAQIRDENNNLVERTDWLETSFLTLLNGKDLGLGYNFLQFNREINRSCQSVVNINNSKSFFGRSLLMCLQYSKTESGGVCG